MMVDLFDPRTWAEPEPCNLYLDNNERLFVLVDEIDFTWACRWRWFPKFNSRKRKVYAFRNLTVRRNGVRYDRSVYLHVEIMIRTGIYRPTADHVVCDHINGKSLDCRRVNLRWATRSENGKNRRLVA